MTELHEEVWPEVERTAQQMLAETEAGVWQHAHSGNPNRSDT